MNQLLFLYLIKIFLKTFDIKYQREREGEPAAELSVNYDIPTQTAVYSVLRLKECKHSFQCI